MKKALQKFLTMVLAIVFLFDMSIACSPGEGKATTPYTKQKGCVRIMSYNILADSIGFDGINPTMRESLLQTTIKTTLPDILCLQEVSNNWYKSLKKFKGYVKFTLPVRNRLSMCMTPILYNPETTELINSGIESFVCSFDSRMRCINWGYFSHKATGSDFIVINTHLSLYDKNQYYPLVQATELLDFVNKIKQQYTCPIFVAGDFNTKQRSEISTDSATYEYLSLSLTDTRFSAKITTSCQEKSVYSPINDYIFYSGSAEINQYTLFSVPQLKTISDHYPIFADVIVS